MRELGDTLDKSSALVADGSDEAHPACASEFIDADSAQQEIAADLAAAPEGSRPFLRYFTLSARIDAGICEDVLVQDRQAVSKLINSLSREPEIVPPVALGTRGDVLRIDLRAYGWTGPVDVNGRAYADHWEALIDNAPTLIQLDGEQGSFISEQTLTRVPSVAADAFIGAASSPEMYYALLGVPATLGELRESVGLPSELDPVANGATRVGITVSRILRLSGELAVVDRYATAIGTAGTYHEHFAAPTGTLLADPLHAQPAVQRQIIFSLPNDLLAFASVDAAGARQGASERVLDTNRQDFTATVPSSCSNCHAFGLLPSMNGVRTIVQAHPEQFDDDVVAAYQTSLDDSAIQAQVDADSAPYLQAIELATGAAPGGDPISARATALSLDVDLAQAAAELLVSAEELRSRIDQLAPEFVALAVDLKLSRAQFSQLYAGAYCVLHAGDDNPPSAAFCATP